MTVRPQPPMEASIEALIVVVAATLPPPSPPPSPLTSYSSPLPQISSPPFHVPSPPPTSPIFTEAPLGYRAAGLRLRTASPLALPLSLPLQLPPPIILPHTRAYMVMMRAAVPSTYCLAPPLGTPPLLPISLPTSSPPLILPSTDSRADVSKIEESSSAPTARFTRGFRADYGFVGTLDTEIRRDPDKEVGYRITNVLVDPDEITEVIPMTDMAKLGQRMADFVTTFRQHTDEIYVRLGDAQDDRSVMSGQLNLLRKDRRFHARTTRLIESKAGVAREAWTQAMDASDTTRSEVRALRTTVLAQQTEIRDLRAADRRRQA
ncbi:hypothetical protein Tco_0363280 [Tanacetum coccineum]